MLNQLSDFDLRLVRVFLAVVDAGGISAAQTVLNVSQSTISTQLATLETRLGFRLCLRGRGGFSLTPKGEQFVRASLQLLEAVDLFCRSARLAEGTLLGTLDIGFIGHAAMSASGRLSKAIARFRERDQAVRLTLKVMTPGVLEEAVTNGNADVGIGYFWHRLPNLEYQPLHLERQLAYCSREHVLFRHSGSVDLSQAAQHDWVWRSYFVQEAREIAAALEENGKVAALADNMEATSVLIRSGRHLGFLPEHFAEPLVQQGLLAALNPSIFQYEVAIHMVTRRHSVRSEALVAFMRDMIAVQQDD